MSVKPYSAASSPSGAKPVRQPASSIGVLDDDLDQLVAQVKAKDTRVYGTFLKVYTELEAFQVRFEKRSVELGKVNMTAALRIQLQPEQEKIRREFEIYLVPLRKLQNFSKLVKSVYNSCTLPSDEIGMDPSFLPSSLTAELRKIDDVSRRCMKEIGPIQVRVEQLYNSMRVKCVLLGRQIDRFCLGDFPRIPQQLVSVEGQPGLPPATSSVKDRSCSLNLAPIVLKRAGEDDDSHLRKGRREEEKGAKPSTKAKEKPSRCCSSYCEQLFLGSRDRS